jgi:hypothetical protein
VVEQLKSRVESIGPDLALKMLDKAKDGVRQRTVSDSRVDSYADVMKRGEWALNGEPIQFDDAGFLLNGQHRLWAVIRADRAVDFLVVRGVDRAHFPTIDQGYGRTTAHVLGIDGHVRGSTLAAALNWLYRYERRTMKSGSGLSNSMTSQQAVDLLGKHPDFEQSIPVADVVKRLAPGSAMVFAHYAFSRDRSAEVASAFFSSLTDGTGLKAADPVYVLREKLIARRMRGTRGSVHMAKLGALEVLALTFKAWTLSLVGGSISKGGLSWRPGRGGEEFPYLGQYKPSRGKAVAAATGR